MNRECASIWTMVNNYWYQAGPKFSFSLPIHVELSCLPHSRKQLVPAAVLRERRQRGPLSALSWIILKSFFLRVFQHHFLFNIYHRFRACYMTISPLPWFIHANNIQWRKHRVTCHVVLRDATSFWTVMTCRLVNCFRRFEGDFSLHFHGLSNPRDSTWNLRQQDPTPTRNSG